MEDGSAELAPGAKAWWGEVRTSAPGGLAGLWFGIVELARGWHLYVRGTETFDPDDETAEWAVPDYAWSPEGGYLAVPRLDSLPVREALAQAVEIVRSLEPWRDVPVLGVAVGFDDGDFELVWSSIGER
jgi:hypothetical protein